MGHCGLLGGGAPPAEREVTSVDPSKVDTVHLAEADPRNLPLAFPGREVLQVPRVDGEHRREVNSGNVMVYASLPNTGTGGVARINLFAELFGVREHVGSAFVVAGAPPASIITVSGHVVDSWHVLVQATGSDLRPRIAIASQDCCGESRVRVNKNNLTPPPELATEVSFNDQMILPPMVPWGRENGQYVLFTADNNVGPTVQTFAPGSRLTRVEIIAAAAADAVVSFTDQFGVISLIPTITVPMGEQVELFVNGDIVVGSVTFSDISFLAVEMVR